jgi:PAS domain S-box-containing protein
MLPGGYGMEKDILERREMEEEILRLRDEIESLRRSSIPESAKVADDLREYGEAMFRTIYKQSQHLAAILDLKGMLKHANKAAWSFTLQAPENFKGKPFWEAPWWAHSALEQEKLRDGIKRAVNGELVRFDTNIYDVDGILRYIDFSIKPVRNDSGRILCLITEAQDITERKLALEQSVQLAGEQRAILYALRIGLCHVKNRILQWINPAFAAMFGYDFDELKGVNSSLFYSSEEDFLRVGKEGYAQIYDSRAYWTEASMKKKSGESIWCAISGQAINPLNADEGSIWVVQDITDRRNAEDALRVSEERFKLMVKYSNDIITLLDAESIQESILGSVEKILGYRPEELTGTNVLALVHPDDVERLKDIFDDLLGKDSLTIRTEFRYKHKDGRWIPMEAVGTNLMGNASIHSIVLNTRDISERNRLQDQIGKQCPAGNV